LSNLGAALAVRFQQAGILTDLDDAVAAFRETAAVSPADHHYRARWLSNLGIVLRVRFAWTGMLSDVDEAVAVGREAVAAFPANHPDHARWLSNVSTALHARYTRTGLLADLDEAVTIGRKAVTAPSIGDPNRATWLGNLSIALHARFERTGVLADLDEAVNCGLEALATIPPNHPDRTLRLSNLSIALHTRFERTGVLADLDEAVTLGREALVTSPPNHPDRALTLSNLGSALQARFERLGQQADLDEAVTAWREAVAIEAAPPRVRAMVARRWGRALAICERWQEALAGFEVALELLGQVTPRSLERRDQEHLIQGLSGLGSEAAACCVHAGLTDRALELFEQGRGVLLGQALDTRTDLTALAEHYPELADQFSGLRDSIDRIDDAASLVAASPDIAAVGRTGQERLVERRRETAQAFEQVIVEIRAMPRFASFLRPLPMRELAASAADGPIVVVNVSPFGSHALILTSNGVLEPVLLDGLTPDSVNKQVDEYLTALNEAPISPTAEQRLMKVLGWLWDMIADPVLDRLGITGPPEAGTPWPRLWWCVSGLLSFLPLHAAGHHHTQVGAAPATVLDRALSSYTPTIRALAHARTLARDNRAGQVDSRDRLLAVAMPHTPGWPDLPGAQAEAAGLQNRFPGHVTVLTGPEATHDAVLKALPTAGWVHFACHGSSDLTNPSANCLLLADYQKRPLTVVDVARLRLNEADLAFLSACSTARPGSRLADEAIHLASAFQLAGYRQVIATLWPIGDQNAVDIADDIYTTLTAHTDNAAAEAVHAAARQARLRWPGKPTIWASHVHIGV
jgi:tetratricopeptide (TPR) repeat protein